MKYLLKNNSKLIFVIVIFIGFLVFFQLFNVEITPRFGLEKEEPGETLQPSDISGSEETVLPLEGVTIPVLWNDFGRRMIDKGVIDAEKFESLYDKRGGMTEYQENLLYGTDNGNLEISSKNAGFILNLLWAFGLANKNSILEEGPIQSLKYGGDAGKFASTGGWTLSEGKAMDYYSKHSFVTLTQDQQDLVEKVSKNIYRPCCGNSTYFPDCNHGMAMLGLLELLASQGANEEQMYKTALQVNSYWFPSTYLTIAEYFNNQGIEWSDVNPKDILGSSYSSSSGYRKILTEVEPQKASGGGGCGV